MALLDDSKDQLMAEDLESSEEVVSSDSDSDSYIDDGERSVNTMWC